MADKTIGQVAYEAAAAVTGCEQPWAEANQEKWEAAAAGVREHDGYDDTALVNAYNEGVANGSAKTIERVLAAVEHDCGLFGEWMRFTPDEVIEVFKAAIRGVGDE